VTRFVIAAGGGLLALDLLAGPPRPLCLRRRRHAGLLDPARFSTTRRLARLTAGRPARKGMKTILIIGIGAGDPTTSRAAVKALNRVDVFFLMDKGPAKQKLRALREELAGSISRTAPIGSPS